MIGVRSEWSVGARGQYVYARMSGGDCKQHVRPATARSRYIEGCVTVCGLSGFTIVSDRSDAFLSPRLIQCDSSVFAVGL